MKINTKLVQVKRSKRKNNIFSTIHYDHNNKRFYGFISLEEKVLLNGEIEFVDTPQEEVNKIEEGMKKKFLNHLENFKK